MVGVEFDESVKSATTNYISNTCLMLSTSIFETFGCIEGEKESRILSIHSQTAVFICTRSYKRQDFAYLTSFSNIVAFRCAG